MREKLNGEVRWGRLRLKDFQNHAISFPSSIISKTGREMHCPEDALKVRLIEQLRRFEACRPRYVLPGGYSMAPKGLIHN